MGEAVTGKRRRGEKSKGVDVPPPARPADSLPASFFRPSARYLFFGGKGGVGKTTVASAAALYLLDHASASERILLFSTDPAHSLSDSLGMQVGDRAVEVARRGEARLEAREMDAGAALEVFKANHRAVLTEVADRGTLLDESDIKELLDLSLPGMDEVMALFELSELDRAGGYTRVVVDTAPSGHTSRLLRLPDVFAGWVSALDLLEDKHRYIVSQFSRGRALPEDEVELFLRGLVERIGRVRRMLYSPDLAAFTLVTIPEAMIVEETSRYFDLLRGEGVPVTGLVINRVESGRGGCKYCRARAAGQSPWLKRLAGEFNALAVRKAPLLAEEVRGLDGLRRFAGLLWEEDGKERGAKGQKRKTKDELYHQPPSSRPQPFAFSALPPSDIAPGRLLIFGGKGGVGKTTSAAAAALAAAEANAGGRVLVFSTDPAHSLSDSFDERIGEAKQCVGGLANLDAMEINPAAWFEGLKRRYRDWTDELFASLTARSRWEIQFDREAMREIVQLAPPGIDEISALGAISSLVDEGRYATIVLDTAPTGHLLRFLELPQVALSWVRTFIKLLLKYKDVVRWGGIAEELIALSKNIKRVAALLTNAEECEFIGVAIAERMSMEETMRLTESLGRLKVPMRRVLINGVVPAEAAGHCDFCGARRRGQESVIEEFKQRFGGGALLVAPQRPHEIRGAVRLREHFSDWKLLA
jgi:arsenite-transporting ATPase